MTRGRSTSGSASLVLAAAMAALSLMSLALPAAAADSPEAAVNELLDVVDRGDLGSLDGLVCEAERSSARELFDIEAAFGIPDEGGTGGSPFDYRIEEREVELIERLEDRASVRVSASLTIEIDEDQARDLVRRMLESEGQEVSEDDLDFMVPFLSSALSQGQSLDEELSLVLEDGEWLVCGGIREPVEEGPVGEISFAGLCGLVSLAEVNAVGPDWLAYDSNSGSEGLCSYFATRDDDYRSLTVSLGRNERLDDYREFMVGGTDVTIAGRPAYQLGDQLYVGLERGVLTLIVHAGERPAEDFEASAYLAQLGDLLVPLVAELPAAQPTAPPAVVEETPPEPEEPSLCEAASVGELTELTGLDFEDATGFPDACSYTSAVSEAGYQLVNTNLLRLGLEELRVVFPGGEDSEVAGLPAYRQGEQLWVELPGDRGVLSVGVFVARMPDATSVDAGSLAHQIAELVMPFVLEQP